MRLRATTASQSSADLVISVTAAVLMKELYVSSIGCRYPDFDAKAVLLVPSRGLAVGPFYGTKASVPSKSLLPRKEIPAAKRAFGVTQKNYLISLTGSCVPKSCPLGATARATIEVNACLYSGYCCASALINAMFC